MAYKTYIKGFDEQLEGGIPEGHVVLIAGTPGTMKSSVAYYILYHNAKETKTPGVYITLEQGKKNFDYHMKRLGMDEDFGTTLGVLDLTTVRRNLTQFKGKSWMELFKMYVSNLKNNLEYKVLVIDSLQVLELLSKMQNPREELFHFFEWLKDLGVTTFVISEMSADSNAYTKQDEDFLADGIIHVKLEKVSEIDVQRRIRCVKMRGVNHNTGFSTLLFTKGEFQTTRTISN